MGMITLKQIRERHYPRSRTDIHEKIKRGLLPPALNTGELGGPSLWDEEAVIAAVAAMIEAAKARGPSRNRDRVEKALAARAQRAEVSAVKQGARKVGRQAAPGKRRAEARALE